MPNVQSIKEADLLRNFKSFLHQTIDMNFYERIVRAPMKNRHENLLAFETGNEPRSNSCVLQPRGIRMAWINEATMH